jgi:trk system potassium uptake protein TrkH
MKVIRLIMLLKVAHRGLYRLIRPHAVVPIRVGRQVIPDSSILEVTGFFFLFMAIFVLGTLYVAAHGIDMATSLTSVAATLSNIGPGLERVGATQHYGDLPGSVKMVLGVFMILGRLELYTVLAILMPVYWRR